MKEKKNLIKKGIPVVLASCMIVPNGIGMPIKADDNTGYPNYNHVACDSSQVTYELKNLAKDLKDELRTKYDNSANKDDFDERWEVLVKLKEMIDENPTKYGEKITYISNSSSATTENEPLISLITYKTYTNTSDKYPRGCILLQFDLTTGYNIIEASEPTVNKANLEKLYNQLDSLDTKLYTDKSLEGIDDLVGRASNAIKGEIDQDEIDVLVGELDAFIKNLVQAYTITFDANGGTISGTTSVKTAGEKNQQKVVTSPTASKLNHTFAGWATTQNEADIKDLESYVFKENTTLYAIYKVNLNTTVLSQYIGKANSYFEDKDEYKNLPQYNAFAEALQDARNALDNATEQSQINSAATKLNDAMEALLNGRKESLKTQINNYNIANYDVKDYFGVGYQNLTDAITDAQDGALTATTPKQLEEILETLTTAINDKTYRRYVEFDLDNDTEKQKIYTEKGQITSEPTNFKKDGYVFEYWYKTSDDSQVNVQFAIPFTFGEDTLSLTAKWKSENVKNLEDAINRYKDKLVDKGNYTETSWNEYQSVYEQTQNSEWNWNNETEVTRVLGELNSKEEDLVKISDLRDLIATVKTPLENNYTTNSIFSSNIEEVLTAAQDTLAKTDATKTDVETAMTNLQNAIKQLVDISSLKTAMDEMPELTDENEGKYTTGSWNSYKEAYEAARVAMNSGTSESIEQALSNLQSANAALVSNERYKTVVSQLEGKNAQDYTNASWQAVQKALNQLEDEDIQKNAKDYDDAVTALESAIDALVNKSALDDLITQVEKLKKNNYTSTSWNESDIENALNRAKNLSNSTEIVTEQQISDMVNALKEAKDKLVPIYTGSFTSKDKNKGEVSAKEVQSGKKVDVEVIKENKEANQEFGKDNVLTTLQIGKAKDAVSVHVEVDKKYVGKDVFVLQQNEETKAFELVAIEKVSQSKAIAFTVEGNQKITLVTSLKDGFINTVATKDKASVTYYIEKNQRVYGWKNFTEGWHFFDYQTGEHQKNKWVADGKDKEGYARWYFLTESGLLKTSQWHCSAKDVWYYVDASGLMVRNQVIDGYAVNQDGVWKK